MKGTQLVAEDSGSTGPTIWPRGLSVIKPVETIEGNFPVGGIQDQNWH